MKPIRCNDKWIVIKYSGNNVTAEVRTFSNYANALQYSHLKKVA